MDAILLESLHQVPATGHMNQSIVFVVPKVALTVHAEEEFRRISSQFNEWAKSTHAHSLTRTRTHTWPGSPPVSVDPRVSLVHHEPRMPTASLVSGDFSRILIQVTRICTRSFPYLSLLSA